MKVEETGKSKRAEDSQPKLLKSVKLLELYMYVRADIPLISNGRPSRARANAWRHNDAAEQSEVRSELNVIDAVFNRYVGVVQSSIGRVSVNN